MFTGIIEKTGRVLTAERREGLRLVLETGFEGLELGESVSVNGVCLTVAERDEATGRAEFFVSHETIARSNLGSLSPGRAVNLERALTLEKRLSGHLVQGHVDGQARFEGATEAPGGRDLRFTLPSDLARYCVEKGSIALDGVSLTLNAVSDDGRIGVTIIPHTWAHTNLSSLKPGDPVNVEVDVLAKYAERLCLHYSMKPSNA
jgi:riboflavin synthase